MKTKLEQEIENLEKQIATLEKKLIKKQKTLYTLNTESHNFVKLSVYFEVNGILHRKHTSFGRGTYSFHYKDEDKQHNFRWFLKYCAFVEKQLGVGGTRLDDTIREYAKYFEIGEEEQEELMQKYWHKRSLTLSEIFETQEIDEIEYGFLFGNIQDFMQRVSRMNSEQGFALAWYCNYNKKAIQDRIDKMPKNIDKVMKELYKIS